MHFLPFKKHLLYVPLHTLTAQCTHRACPRKRAQAEGGCLPAGDSFYACAGVERRSWAGTHMCVNGRVAQRCVLVCLACCVYSAYRSYRSHRSYRAYRACGRVAPPEDPSVEREVLIEHRVVVVGEDVVERDLRAVYFVVNDEGEILVQYFPRLVANVVHLPIL